MNTQLIKGFITLCCLAFCMTVAAQNSPNNDSPLKGTWTFSLPDAPDGYEKGTIEFKQVEDKLTANVKTANGNFTIREIKKVEQQYTCTFYVDGGNVTINFEPKADAITGIVKVDGWEMRMTMTPVKE
jgi:hypothetical protein